MITQKHKFIYHPTCSHNYKAACVCIQVTYINPPYATDVKIPCIGSGKTLKEAKKEALKNISIFVKELSKLKENI